MCRTKVQRPNVPRPEKGVAQHLRAGTSYRKGGMPCSALPDFSPGEPVPVSGCNIVRKRTLPVSPYTDEELVGYMDRSGLGTVSTRTNIIRTLLERKYIRYSGKYVIPTQKGFSSMKRYVG